MMDPAGFMEPANSQATPRELDPAEFTEPEIEPEDVKSPIASPASPRSPEPQNPEDWKTNTVIVCACDRGGVDMCDRS